MSELLRLENIHKTYPMGAEDVHVLRGINLAIEQGEFVAIMGASGSGKSTLLHIAGALDTPDYIAPGLPGVTSSKKSRLSGAAGEVIFKNQPLSQMGRWGRHHLRNHEFGFVFQFYHLLPELTVLENVLLPAMVAAPFWKSALRYAISALFILFYICAGYVLDTTRGILEVGATMFLIVLVGEAIRWLLMKGLNRLLRITRDLPRRDEALRLIEAFGLSHRLKHRPAELSGGERQRVAIARALINNPALLLADEPTGNLDAATGRAILDVLVNLHKTRGQTILMVTHDPNVAALADRTVRLAEGRIKGQ